MTPSCDLDCAPEGRVRVQPPGDRDASLGIGNGERLRGRVRAVGSSWSLPLELDAAALQTSLFPALPPSRIRRRCRRDARRDPAGVECATAGVAVAADLEDIRVASLPLRAKGVPNSRGWGSTSHEPLDQLRTQGPVSWAKVRSSSRL